MRLQLLLIPSVAIAVAAPAASAVRTQEEAYLAAALVYEHSSKDVSVRRQWSAEWTRQADEIDRLNGQLRVLRRQAAGSSAAANERRGEIQLLTARIGVMTTEFNDRIAVNDAQFAIERAEFIDNIGGLLDADDPEIRKELAQYAAGDRSALTRLGAKIRARDDKAPLPLVLVRGYAALADAGAEREQAAVRDAIEAWEAVLRRSPEDDDALNRLTWLYVKANRPADARRVAQVSTEIAQPKLLKAGNLMSQGNLALKDRDFSGAARSLRQSIALFSDLADPASAEAKQNLTRGDGTSRDQAQFEFVLWIHSPLASALRSLSMAEEGMEQWPEAIEHARLSVAYGEVVMEATRKRGKTDNAYGLYQVSYLTNLGRIELEAGRASEALATFERAATAGRSAEGKVGAWTSVQVAKAAMAAGRPEVAERNLGQARVSMTEMRPSAFALGVEGLYWEQMAALAASRKLDRAPPLKRAEAALSQAVRMAPSEADEWRAALVRVRQTLAAG